MRKIFNSIVTLSLIMILGTTASCKKNNEPKVEEPTVEETPDNDPKEVITNPIQIGEDTVTIKTVKIYFDTDGYGYNIIFSSGENELATDNIAFHIDINIGYTDGSKHEFKDMQSLPGWSDFFLYRKYAADSSYYINIDNCEDCTSGSVKMSIDPEKKTIDIDFEAVLTDGTTCSVAYKGAYIPSEDYIDIYTGEGDW